MLRGKKREPRPSEPLRWRIVARDGFLSVVLVDMAPPLGAGETLVWEGLAKHMTEAYRLARNSGLSVYLAKDGFKLRKAKPDGGK